MNIKGKKKRRKCWLIRLLWKCFSKKAKKNKHKKIPEIEIRDEESSQERREVVSLGFDSSDLHPNNEEFQNTSRRLITDPQSPITTGRLKQWDKFDIDDTLKFNSKNKKKSPMPKISLKIPKQKKANFSVKRTKKEEKPLGILADIENYDLPGITKTHPPRISHNHRNPGPNLIFNHSFNRHIPRPAPPQPNQDLNRVKRNGLSEAEIESIPILRFTQPKKGGNLDRDKVECPICLVPFKEGDELRLLFCLHRYHKKCGDEWLRKKTTCPLCSFNFRGADQEKFA